MDGEPDDQRAFVIECAFKVFSERGIDDLTLRRVAREGGLSTGDVARHFSDETRLVTGMVAARDQRLAARISELAPGSDADYRESLDAAIRAIVEDRLGTRLFVIAQHEALQPGHPMQDYLHMRNVRAVDQMRSLFEEHFADPDSLSVEVIAIMEGLQIRFVREPESFNLERHWNAIADALFEGVPRAEKDQDGQRFPRRSKSGR